MSEPLELTRTAMWAISHPLRFRIWEILRSRELDRRMLATFFARDEEVRPRFVLGRPSDEWQEASFVGSWFLALTPAEADELGRRLFALVDELRAGPPSAGAEQTLVSLSILPVLEEASP